MEQGMRVSVNADCRLRLRRTVGAVMALCSAGAFAQTSAPASPPAPAPLPMAAPAASPVFQIKGFNVTGENPLGAAETNAVLAPFIRPNATIEVLQQATAALEGAFRRQGYSLHRVALPPQEVGETVRLDIVRFTVGKVSIEGSTIYDEGNIRRSVPELREGGTPNFRTLARQTAIANENPNKQVQVAVRESDEPDKIDATISVKQARPWTLAISVSNTGSKSNGKDRVTVAGGYTNLWNMDHQFIAAYTTSFDNHDDVKQIGLSYRAPLYQTGGMVGISYTKSDVVGNFGTFTSTGAGHTYGVNYTHYLVPEGGRRRYITVDLENKLYEAAVVNGIPVPGASDRRSTPLGLSFSARTETDAAVWGYSIGVAANTGMGSNNSRSAYQTEDPRIKTSHWKAMRANGSYAASLGANWQWAVRGQAQYSPNVLIAGEQFGLGGLLSVRGTETERPISGDKGISASFEVTSPEIFQGLRALGFFDAGYIRNNGNNTPAKPANDTLASVGVGLRFNRGPWIGTADYGRLVNGSKVPRAVNSNAPKDGEDKLYVTLSLRF